MGAFNGSGTFVRSFNWVTDKTNGVNITASRVDTEDDGYATGLSLCVTRDGQGKMSADFLPSVDNTYNLGSVTFRWSSINGITYTDFARQSQSNTFLAVGNPYQTVFRSTTAAGYTSIRLQNDQASAFRALEIDYSGSTYAGVLLTNGPTGESASIGTNGNFPLSLGTNLTERMRISGAGAVTINAPSAGFALTLSGTNGLSVAGTASIAGLLTIATGSPGINMNNCGIYNGSGNPNTVVNAQVGSIYLNTAGGAITTLWVKESGVGTNTGWVAK